jgi:hypothetical protein
MASLKLLLGMIPSTSKLEHAENALIAEFEKLRKFSESDILARYNELDHSVNSAEFKQKCKDIKSLRYNDSDEYYNEKEYNSLRKSKDIIWYYKTSSGNDLKRFRDMDGSGRIKEYETLEAFIESPVFREKQRMKPLTFKDTDEYRKWDEYKTLRKDPEIRTFLKPPSSGGFFRRKKPVQKTEPVKTKAILRFEDLEKFIKSDEFLAKKNMKPITFKDSAEYKKLVEYKRLKGTLEIKEYYKFRNSKEYASYLNTDGSARLNRHKELKEYVASSDFIKRKEYLLDKKKFEKTDLYRDEKEYRALKKNPDIIWYFKIRDSKKFDILRNRELTFHDEFEGAKLDTSKWLTNYYWGEKLLGDRYSYENDLQKYTEKENFEISNSVLKIITRAQKATGKVWTAKQGFIPKEFSYTSGLINTGNSFRQKYGLFTAKVRLGNPSARNSFWMLADKIAPHLDVCRTSGGKIWFDYFSSKGNKFKQAISSKYSRDFYIYSLEWTPDKLVWKINNVEICSQSADLPADPMYILFSGGLDKPVNGHNSMEIDWIRVYKNN